jgi:ABC-2 type transport system permease protein
MSRPARAVRATLAMAAMELRLTARRSENVLVMIVIPAVVLVFFASVAILPVAGRPVDFLLPGSIALAIIATGMVNLGIATAYERHYGVLKRLGGSPLPRAGWLTAKILSVLAVEIAQLVLLVLIAVLVLGWDVPAAASLSLFVVAVVLGTAAFTGLGLAMAGAIRAEATLALANLLFIGFLLLGGVVLPLDHLPGWLSPIAALLPASALADTLRIALGGSGDAVPRIIVLGVWAIGASLFAGATFRWE